MRTMKTRAALLAAGMLLVAACGGSSDGADSGEADATGTAAAITIQDFSFGDPLSVAVGDRVTVTNDDGATHTWTSVDGAFDSGNLGSGDSFEFTFTEAGEFGFICQIHPSMTGTVTVAG